jgi:hypothetical protein
VTPPSEPQTAKLRNYRRNYRFQSGHLGDPRVLEMEALLENALAVN